MNKTNLTLALLLFSTTSLMPAPDEWSDEEGWPALSKPDETGGLWKRWKCIESTIGDIVYAENRRYNCQKFSELLDSLLRDLNYALQEAAGPHQAAFNAKREHQMETYWEELKKEEHEGSPVTSRSLYGPALELDITPESYFKQREDILTRLAGIRL